MPTHNKPLPHTITLPLLMLLAISSLSTKAMGAAWVLLTITGLWALCHTRPTATSSAEPWIKTWLITTAVAMALKTVPTLYWADPWDERHGEMRLLLGAVAVWGLSRWKTLDTLTTSRLADALSLSSALGLGWVLAYGRDAVCTHPIPWAMIMAITCCWLLSMGFDITYGRRLRYRWQIGALAAVMAVLSSKSRGAFGVLLLWAPLMWWHFLKQPHHKVDHLVQLKRWKLRFTVLLALIVGILALIQTPVLQRPGQAIVQAIEEIRASQKSVEVGSNSSVGARLYMWHKSWEAIQINPWIGYGHDGRKELLKQWATQANSEEVKKLGHVHNEYLNQWIDSGLLGILSQCIYIIGFILMTKQLWKAKKINSAILIGCIGFMHISGSMSNVNFAHNYYTTGLSMFVLISLWLTKTPQKNEGPK